MRLKTESEDGREARPMLMLYVMNIVILGWGHFPVAVIAIVVAIAIAIVGSSNRQSQ